MIWIELPEVDSTNNYLRTYRPHDALTLVTADYQTSGRGQTANVWESARGQNLLCSYLFTPPAGIRPAGSFVVNQAIALAVRDACQQFAGDEVLVKWPNDIYVAHRKLSGILIETAMTAAAISRVIAGIGINVNQTDWQFPTAHTPTPVSLNMLTGNEIPVRSVAEALTRCLQLRIDMLHSGHLDAIRADYLGCLYRRQGTHPYRDHEGTFLASIHGIEPSGHLLLADTDGRLRRYAFKEVEIIR